MKSISIFLSLFFVGCASIPTPDPVCERPGAETSIICDIATQHNFSPEDLYYGLVDSTAITLIASKQTDKPFLTKLMVANYVQDIKQHVIKNDPLTFVNLVDYMTFRMEQSQDAELIASIINRRIGYFRGIVWMIPEFDRQLIINACDSFLRDLFIQGGS